MRVLIICFALMLSVGHVFAGSGKTDSDSKEATTALKKVDNGLYIKIVEGVVKPDCIGASTIGPGCCAGNVAVCYIVIVADKPSSVSSVPGKIRICNDGDINDYTEYTGVVEEVQLNEDGTINDITGDFIINE